MSKVVKKTAGWTRSALIIWDINISFNYDPPYYLMNRGDGGIVIKRYLVTKFSGKKFDA